MTGATLSVVGLLGQWFPGDQRDAEIANNFLIAGLYLMGPTSATGVIWAISFLIPSLWMMNRCNGITLVISRQNVVLAICGFLMIPVAYQYVSTFSRGVTASTFGEHKIANFVFGFYEIFGASVLGPGRDELRVASGKTLLQYALSLLLYSVVILTVTAYGMVELLRKEKNRAIFSIVMALLPVGIFFSSVK
jgi:hypothetical protein